MNREIRLTLVKINKLILSENYEESLKVSDDLLKEDLDKFTLAEVYHQKAICFINLEKYKEALSYLTKSYELSKYYLDHEEFDKVFNQVYDTNFNKSYWLILCKKSMENSHERDARNYFKYFLRSNRGVNEEFLSSFLGFTFEDILMEFQITSKIKHFEQLSPSEISKFMGLAKECISSDDYENAIKYLNKLGDYEPALEIKSDLLIQQVIDNYILIHEDYNGFWRNIGYLTEATKVNDEALLIKAYLLLEAGLFERSLECYDSYLGKHEKDKRAIYGKIVVLNELYEYDNSLDLIKQFSAKYWEYLKAEILSIKGKSGTAVKVLNALLKDNENDINAILTKTTVYSIDLKFDKILRECDKVLEIQPKNVDALLLKGEMLFGFHKYKKAIKSFKTIPNKKLPEGYKKLIKYIENDKGENSGFYGVFKKDYSWEYVYVESDIFKRLKSESLDDLKNEVKKRGLIWKGTDRSLQMKTSYQNNLRKNFETELLYDFDKKYNTNPIEISYESIDSFDEILKSDDKNYKILNNKGYVLLKLGKIDESIDYFNKALEINPDDYYAWFNKGFAHIHNEDCIESKECILKSFELNNFSNSFKEKLSDYLYDLGWSFYESEKYQGSIACYDICIEFYPQVSSYYNCKAISLHSLGEYDKSLEFYDKALYRNPYEDVFKSNKLYCLQDKIFDLFNQEDYDGCVNCCDEYLRLSDEDNYEIWYLKGTSLGMLEKFEESLLCLDKAINLSDNEYAHHFNSKAISLEHLEKFDEALEFYDKALVIEPDDVIKNNKLYCLENKIFYLFNRDDYDGCVNCCDEYLKLNNNNYEVWNVKGDSLRLLERFDEALSCFDKAIELVDDGNAQLYNSKAISLEYLGRFDEALEFYDKALAIEPDDDVIKNNKVDCMESKLFALFNQEDYDKCVICCDVYLKLDNNNSKVFDLKGDSLRLLGRFEEAVPCFDSAIKYSDEENAQYYNLKAISLVNLKRFDEALDAYDKAIEIEPDEDIINNKESCILSKIYFLLENKDYVDACRFCDRAIELFPENYDFYHKKGICLVTLNKFEDSIEFFNKYIELRQENTHLINDKGYCINQTISFLMIISEDYVRACDLCDKAIDMSVDISFNYLNKVTCLQRLNKFDEALECMDKAFEVDYEGYLNKNFIKIRYFEDKLNYLIDNGNADEIKECLNEALKLDSNHEYFINLKNKLGF